MKKYRIYQVDSFTRERFIGNPAGVVSNADGLTDRQMQEIARELNNSETAFIFSSECSDYDVRVRFFTPTVEVPSCGHATIAAHYVRAVENQLSNSIVLQRIGIGILPVDIEKSDCDYRITMTQGEVKFLGFVEDFFRRKLSAALRIDEDELNASCPIEHFSTGHSKIIVPLKNRRMLNALKPDLKALAELNEELNSGGYFLFTLDSDDPEILTYARVFAPQIGIGEDPVTGNGNGPLGAYLVKNGLVPSRSKTFAFKGRQGEAINRAGVAHASVESKDGVPLTVKVGGDAVMVFQTEINL